MRLWHLGALVVCASVAQPTGAVALSPPRELPARSWIVVDAADGHVLAAQRPDRRSAIASTTKLMTAYLALRDLDPARTVTAPRYRAAAGESLMGLRAGEMVSVRDLLYGLLLPSGNDAAAALASASAGSTPAFVAQMNAAAAELGLGHTSYANPIGLDDPANFSSARDLVDLADRLLGNRLFARIVATRRITLSGGEVARTLTNLNTLLRQASYVSGVKTGYTPEAGNVLVGSAERGEASVITAVLGAPSEAERDDATLALLNYGLALFHRRAAVRQGEVLQTVPLAFSDQQLGLVAARGLRLTVREGQSVEVNSRPVGELQGPIDKGERFGVARVMLDGDRVGSVPLVAAHAVGAPTIVDRADAALPGSRTVAWLLAAALVIGILITAKGLLRRGRRQS